MIPAVLFVRQNAGQCKRAIRWLSSVSKASTQIPPNFIEQKRLCSLMKDVVTSPTAVSSRNTVLHSCLDQHLSAGYQLPTVWYNTVMKKTIIDPLANFSEYDLPTNPGRAERIRVPEGSTAVTPMQDPNSSEITQKMVLPWLVTIRHKKMKKHKLRKLRKRMLFVMRKRRVKKQKRKEREIQLYEREQVQLGKLYDADKFVEEQLALARKSGWHIDIIAEFVRDKEKEKERRPAASAAGSNNAREKP